MTDQMREEFHKEMRKRLVEEARLARHLFVTDAYHDDAVQSAWQVWQAAWNRRTYPTSDADWISHPQTIEAKRQWDEVAQALGVDSDDVDAVLAAAKAKSKAVEVTDAMARTLAEHVDRILAVEDAHDEAFIADMRFALEAALQADAGGEGK